VAHWGVPDPAEATGTDAQIFKEFRQAAFLLQRRIELFCSLPIDKLDRLKLEQLTKDIGTLKRSLTDEETVVMKK